MTRNVTIGRHHKTYDRHGRLVYATASNATIERELSYTDAPHQPRPRLDTGSGL